MSYGTPTLLRIFLLLKMFRSLPYGSAPIKQWNSNYDTLLNALTVPTLSSRRKTQKLCTLFSILTGKFSFPHCPTPRNTHYSSRHLSSVQLTIPHCRTNSYKHSFLWIHPSYGIIFLSMWLRINNSVTVLKHKLINSQL